MPKGWRPEPGDIIQHVPTRHGDKRSPYIAIVDRIDGDKLRYVAIYWTPNRWPRDPGGWKMCNEYDLVGRCDDVLEPFAGDVEEVWLDFTKWRLLNG